MRRLKAKDIIYTTHVESVSNWTWAFCKQFVKLVHAPTLLLPTSDMRPSAAVFAKLAINDVFLLDPTKSKKVFEHCEIEKVMKTMGYVIGVDPYTKVLDDNRRMVNQLGRARREEKSQKRHEMKIDQCAGHFLQLCGFDDDPFDITAEGADFKIFGKVCHSVGDHYVVVTPSNDLVLVFEDKSLEDGQLIEKRGHLGQIVGELLQMLSLNRDNNTFRNVFAVRFVNYRVTAFRVEPCSETLATLCDTDRVPTSKIKLMCTEKTPQKHLGLSLIDQEERLKALQIMADMRRFILTRKFPYRTKKMNAFRVS